MKFLVISRPRQPGDRPNLTAEQTEQIGRRLQELMDSGIIEKAFAFTEGGGSAYIINAPSYADVARGIREHNLSLRADIEIHELRDFDWAQYGL